MPEVAAAGWLGGGVAARPEEAVRFLRAWHGVGGGEAAGAGLVSVVPLDSRTGWAGRSAFGSLTEVCDTLGELGLDEMIWQRDELGERRAARGRARGGRASSGAAIGPFNLYTNVGELGRAPDRSHNPFARGCKKDMSWVPGAWIDLDVGDGRFAGSADCLAASRVVGVEPSVLVDSGSGGVHAYWRVEGGVRPDLGELLAARVIEQVRSCTGVKVDSVHNSDRIMRLPGSVRWPKAGEGLGAPAGLCRVLVDDGPVCTAAELLAATESVWAGVSERRRAARADADREFRAACGRVGMRGRAGGGRLAGLAGEGGLAVGGRWTRMRDVACAEGDFAAERTWESVLEPFGWRLLDGDGCPDGKGRRTWTRPGAGGVGTNPRSLITDWEESPDVASLLSEAPETGLWKLKEAGLALTKMRVWVELAWAGDMAGFLEAWLDGRGGDV